MDGTRPLVTVIVAVYNIKKYIRRCVDSILDQTYTNLEILLVDDGASDGSGEICDEYAGKDERIRVIHKQNGGLSDARNAGLDAANGTFIGYVDGDDWIEPTMYECMVHACEAWNAQIAVCRYDQYVEQNGTGGDDADSENVFLKLPTDENPPTGKTVCFSADEALQSFICAHAEYKIHNSVWSKLFAREVCMQFRFPVGKNSEDIMYTTRTFCKAERIAFVDRPLYNYVADRPGSIMNVGLFKRRIEHEIPFWREQVSYLEREQKEELAERAAFYFYRRLLFYYREACEVKAATGQQKREQRRYAALIAEQMRKDRGNVMRVTKKAWAPRGDRVRMRLFIMSPVCYEWTCRLYDRIVVPFKKKDGAASHRTAGERQRIE